MNEDQEAQSPQLFESEPTPSTLNALWRGGLPSRTTLHADVLVSQIAAWTCKECTHLSALWPFRRRAALLFDDAHPRVAPTPPRERPGSRGPDDPDDAHVQRRALLAVAVIGVVGRRVRRLRGLDRRLRGREAA